MIGLNIHPHIQEYHTILIGLDMYMMWVLILLVRREIVVVIRYIYISGLLGLLGLYYPISLGLDLALRSVGGSFFP